MILIARHEWESAHADVIPRLTRAGYPVVTTSSPHEAFRIVREARPRLLVLGEIRSDRCPYLLCGWVKRLPDRPRMLALTRVDDPRQRARCEACLTLLPANAHPAVVEEAAVALAGAS